MWKIDELGGLGDAPPRKLQCLQSFDFGVFDTRGGFIRKNSVTSDREDRLSIVDLAGVLANAESHYFLERAKKLKEQTLSGRREICEY